MNGRRGIRNCDNACYMEIALKVLAEMTLHRARPNQHTIQIIQQIHKQRRLSNEQLGQHIVQLTQLCNFAHKRMEFQVGARAKMIPSTRPAGAPDQYITIINREITCTRCGKDRQLTEFGYVIQILNTIENAKMQGQIDATQNRNILRNREFHLRQRRANSPEITTIHTPTDNVHIQYTRERNHEDHWDPPELPRQMATKVHNG